MENNIDFDMIMVNYNYRSESVLEVDHAKTLSSKHNKKLYLLETKLTKFSEKNARDLRYDFFDQKMVNYDNLILGHNLSDKLEWFLMQMSRGAGVSELFGMEGYSTRKGYHIVRPLIEKTKEEIMSELHRRGIEYFYDRSNNDQKFERNHFRHNFSEPFLKKFSKGVAKTFQILEKEKRILESYVLETEKDEFYVYSTSKEMATNLLSKHLKKCNYVLSGGQRAEFEKNGEIVAGGYAATFKSGKLYISPFVNKLVRKKDREKMRTLGIPPKHRPYYKKFL